jgi:CheY-like chemotaxis protein
MSDYRYDHVLLIDDNDADNFVNKRLMEITNFSGKISVVQSATAGLDFLKKESASPGNLPEIIFLDILMPVMDGFGFLEQFEKLPDAVRLRCKIVMLSSSESFKDLNRANKNRYVSKFLNKPLVEEVLAAINV